MTIRHLVHATSTTGMAILLMAASANASTVTYSTDVNTVFASSNSLILNNTLGAAATLTFIPDVNIVTGVPSNVNFGNFTLVCPLCSTQALGAGTYFAPFTFDLVITDVTNSNATGTFVGTSTGGTAFSDVSNLTVNWAPLVLGPGTTNAAAGSNFGTTVFSTTVFTGIVAPNSGAVPGQSTVQGYVTSTAIPEPATLGLIGGALLGLGVLRRKGFLLK